MTWQNKYVSLRHNQTFIDVFNPDISWLNRHSSAFSTSKSLLVGMKSTCVASSNVSKSPSFAASSIDFALNVAQKHHHHPKNPGENIWKLPSNRTSTTISPGPSAICRRAAPAAAPAVPKAMEPAPAPRAETCCWERPKSGEKWWVSWGLMMIISHRIHIWYIC